MALTVTKLRDTDYNLIAVDKNGVSPTSEKLTASYRTSYTNFVEYSEITASLSKRPIRDTLTALHNLLSWGANWNSYDALPPDPRAVMKAENVIIALSQTIELLGLFWMTPNVSASPDGEVVFEWRYGKKKLTIYVGDQSMDYVQVWGADIRSKITDGEIENNYKLRSLWVWLIS